MWRPSWGAAAAVSRQLFQGRHPGQPGRSAQRLGVETLDLAQIHCVPTAVLRDGRIFGWMDDSGMRAGAALGASVETIEEGLLCSSSRAARRCRSSSTCFRQDAAKELLPKAAAQDVGIIVRLPLASGLLTGKYDKATRFDASDHRNYNADGAAFSVGETFSGLPFDRGIETGRRAAGPGARGHADEPVRAAVDS